MEEALNIIPLGLFLLGVIFLFIGWRWQSPRGEENMAVLKGLAYLRSEISRVQDRVHGMEREIIETKRLYNRHEAHTIVDHNVLVVKKEDQKEAVSKQVELQDIQPKELQHLGIEMKKLVHQEREQKVEPEKVESKNLEFKGTGHIQKAKLYSITPHEHRERGSSANKRMFDDEKIELMRQAPPSAPQSDYLISGKFREVLELAEHGHHIPEIAQRLFISQDAVRMVLRLQSKGGAR